MKRIEYFFKNLLLKILILFNPVSKEPTIPDFNNKSNLLFIRLNRIGDALVTTPLFYEIKKQLGCNIYVLADRKNHFVFRNNPSIDEVIVFNKKFDDFLSFNKLLRERSIDAVIDLHDDVSTTVSFLIALAKTRYKFGLKKSNYKIYSNTIDKLDPTKYHIIERIMKLSALFKINVELNNISVRYFPTGSEQKIADDQVVKMNPGKKYLIGINVSAGSEARFWGVDNYKNVFEMLKNYDARIIVLCSSKDLHYANLITSNDNIYPVTDSFGIFASAILKLDFLITPDTSIVHIASIKRIPVFGLYVKYNTEDMIWRPYNCDFECVETKEATLKNVALSEVKNKLVPFLENHLNVKRNPGL